MDRNYSFLADGLSKFQTFPGWVQAVWIVAGFATVVSITWIVVQGAVEITRILRKPKTTPPPRSLNEEDWRLLLDVKERNGIIANPREFVRLVRERREEDETPPEP